jgi:biopolymer transport protein ExbD
MDDRGFESINVIPFIDIMLVLLTIVLTTSTFIATGAIGVQLPKASASKQPANSGVIIEVNIDGELTLNQQRLKLADLAQHLEDYPKQTPVLIRADAALPLQEFVSVMDNVKMLGFQKLNLQTETN